MSCLFIAPRVAAVGLLMAATTGAWGCQRSEHNREPDTDASVEVAPVSATPMADAYVVFDAAGDLSFRLERLRRPADEQWTLFDNSGRQVLAVVAREKELLLVERDRDAVSYVAVWSSDNTRVDVVDGAGVSVAGLRAGQPHDRWAWRLLDGKGRGLVVSGVDGALYLDDAMRRPLRVPIRMRPEVGLLSGWLAVHSLPFEVRLMVMLAHARATTRSTTSTPPRQGRVRKSRR